jgi:branched-subunit amino acid aminotransferase/4-amino-4-deoxychorismate lyase
MRSYLDGHWVTKKDARMGAYHSGLLYGEAVFESIPLYGGQALFLDDHLRRLTRGCRFLGWEGPSRERVGRVLSGLAREWGKTRDLMARLTMYQPIDPSAPPRQRGSRPVLLGTARALRHDPLEVLPRSGKVGVARWRLPGREAYPYGFKTAFYLTALAELRAHPTWDEMLRLDREGCVVDGAWSSPLWVLGRKVMSTPPGAAGLESVTRKRVLGLCRRLGFDIQFRPWKPGEVRRRGGELLFVGSGVGVWSAASMPGRRWKGIGPAARLLWAHYREWARQTASKSP